MLPVNVIFQLVVLCWSVTGGHDFFNEFIFDWELRLNGADSYFGGLLEIRYGDQWGYVCSDGFGKNEANVVCNIIATGISSSSQAVEVYSVSASGLDDVPRPIILEGLKCNGTEDRIFECQHNGLFNASCPSSAVVGIRCLQHNEQYINNVFARKTHVGVYFRFYDRVMPRKLLLCNVGLHWGISTTERFLTENDVQYSMSNRYCGREDPHVTQCNPHRECNSNDTIISIYKRYYIGDYHFLPITAIGGPRHLRLARGNTSQEGRLEVTLGFGVWGSVCSRFWSYGSASLVCRRLGFAAVETYGNFEGNASYPLLQYLSCNDEHETDWHDCLFRYSWPENDACSSYAFVKCSDFANEGTLRLVGTTVAVEGRLQIFHEGVWGGVRHRYFSSVVCNQLGYPGGNYSSAFITFDVYPLVPVILDIIACNGSEVSVLDCEHQWYNESYPDKYVGGVDVRCNLPGEFTPRLYNGTSVYEGRLEVWASNQWRRVCSSTIGPVEAEIICKHLGHQSLDTFFNWPKFGNGINPVLSWSFSCNHVATSLKMCDFSNLTTRKLDCESVAIKCTKKNKDLNEREETETNNVTNLKVLLGVVFLFLGLSLVSGLMLYKINKWRMRTNEPTAGTH